MRTQQEEDELTLKIAKAKSWKELKELIERNAPFISHSRSQPMSYDADETFRRVRWMRQGLPDVVTRANGLRAKVSELIMANNYGEPWD